MGCKRNKILEPTLKNISRKKRVCAYARVSTDNYEQGESLENQITYYGTLISSNPEYELVGIFADKGISGTTENRPDFQKMLGLCRERKIDLIITKSISRFARNTTIVLKIVRELKELSIEVIFEKENISTLSKDGEFMLSVLSSFAEEESRSISENTKWRVRKKFETGQLIINTNRFLGYDKNEFGELVINPAEAEIVERIYSEYLSGKGTFTIAKQLAADNIPTVAGGKWCESTILGILKNEKYMGDVLLQKYYIPNHLKKSTVLNNGELDSYYIEENHSPIIPKDVWSKVQIEIVRRAREKGNFQGNMKYQNRYPLSGMLYCSICGAVLRRRTWNSKEDCRKIVWQCSNYIRNGNDVCPGTILDDEIASRLNIHEPTIVKETIKNGKKHYSYSGKSKQTTA